MWSRDGDGEPELSGELAGVAGVISMPIAPPQDFVSALERRLMGAQVVRPVEGASRSGILRAPVLRFATPVAGLVAVAAIVTFTLLRDAGSAPPPLHADVIRQSALSLFDLDTVRYVARVETMDTGCYQVFGAALTDEQKAILVARGEEPVDTGIIFGCGNSFGMFPEYGIEERGVYDLAHNAFTSEVSEFGSRYPVGIDPKSAFDRETGETVDLFSEQFPITRVLVDETLYTRYGEGGWEVRPGYRPWVPFQFPSFNSTPVKIRGVPFTDLDYLSKSYDDVEFVGTERIYGKKVFHYRVERVTPGLSNMVETWIGADDGLPRKAVVALKYTRQSAEDYQESIRRQIESDPERQQFKNAPIFQVGEWSDASVFTYTYEFSDFNEPVSITAPAQ
jgi:hypothetical protein